MAEIKTFKGVRPPQHLAHLVATRSYISYSDEELKAKLEYNPYSFLHIINPDYFEENNIKTTGIEKYKLVNRKYHNFLQDGFLIKEEKPVFYLYKQITPEHTFSGIIGSASVNDYLNGHIKVHEQTLEKREKMFTDYLKTSGFNAEPVLLTYPDHNDIDSVCNKYLSSVPLYDFNTANKVRHQMWIIHDDSDIQIIENTFKAIPDLYIADGHHRSASSARLYSEYYQSHPNHESAFYLSCLIPESQLKILEFNRWISETNGLSKIEFISKIQERFQVKETGTEAEKLGYNQIAMYYDTCWYTLSLKSEFLDENDPVKNLDSDILSKHLLEPVLNIVNLKTDERVEFITGKTDKCIMEKKVDDNPNSILFVLKPVSIDQLKAVADNHLIMPPKSTYIEPKLRSGLIVYEYE